MSSYTVSVLEASAAVDATFNGRQNQLYVSRGGDIDVFDLAAHVKTATWHVGAAVGPLTLSDDGTFLLASDPRQPFLYKISTSTGAVVQTFTGTGNAYSDIELVNDSTALVSNTDAYSQAHPALLDLRTGALTALTSTAGNSNFNLAGRETLSEDNHLTLITDGNSSGGPLHIFDGRTGSVVANGGDGVFNYGVQAISEAAGLAVIGEYGQGIALFDLELGSLRNINLGYVNGLAFDLTGKHLYVAEAGQFNGQPGTLVEYDSAKFNEIARFDIGPTTSTNSANVRYGDNVLASDNERFLVITDPDNSTVTLIERENVASNSSGSDFDGNGHSDILWHNVNGAVSAWGVFGDGSDVQQGANDGAAATSWHINETFDFNGDGLSDLLWRNDNGAVAVWGATGTGFNQGTFYQADPVPNEWRIAGTGDLNGDGKDDIIWQFADGQISTWNATGTGFAQNAYSHASVGASWKVDGLADFNGDGLDDILWRNTDGSVSTWLNNGQGGFSEGSFYQGGLPTSWHIAGAADFTGDGKADILWRNDNGAVSEWRSNGNGFDEAVYNTNIPISWHIAATGDYNADGKADILWHNDNGAVSTWQSSDYGFDQAVYNSSAPIGWDNAAHHFLL